MTNLTRCVTRTLAFAVTTVVDRAVKVVGAGQALTRRTPPTEAMPSSVKA